MATIAEKPRKALKPISADRFERVLAGAAIVLLAVVLVALARGYPHWGQVPGIVWAHLVTIIVALALTPVMLLRRRGDGPHRVLGTIWVAAMLLTALISFGVRMTNHGSFSIIHPTFPK